MLPRGVLDIVFLSTPSARRATVPLCWGTLALRDFYPRPPRGGRPHSWHRQPHTPRYFYPRPPRGGRLTLPVLVSFPLLFLSTPSARRATKTRGWKMVQKPISIHALREEGDLCPDTLCLAFPLFLSTPSARRATTAPQQIGSTVIDFYPRPPRGGRQQKQRQNLYFLINYTTFCTNLEEP